jgi:polyhydroxyalkanoate synthase
MSSSPRNGAPNGAGAPPQADAGRFAANLLTAAQTPLPRPGVDLGATPADVVHNENKWRLLRYRARPGGPARPTPLLLVPSLINRHYVLDLMPGKSLVEYLVAEGVDVFLIDWGTPGDEDRLLTFDEITDRYLGRALRRACTVAGSEKAHVLGYCLGGTLAVIHAAVHQERIASLTALAAPVQFSDGGLLSAWTRVQSFDVNALTEAFGNAPWPMMQSAFQLLRPTLVLPKLVGVFNKTVTARTPEEMQDFLQGYLALDAWGNDNVSFPGACYRRYVEELYRGDALVQGTFTLSGRPARLENITCPTLAVTFEHDGIVPPKSAQVLLERVGTPPADRELLHLQGGHVGAVVSRAAGKVLWPKLLDFWARHDPAARKARAPAAHPAPAETVPPAAPAPGTPASSTAVPRRARRARRPAARSG